LEKDGFAVDEQVIMFGGKPLEDEVALSSLSELSTLDVDLRMLGGPKHLTQIADNYSLVFIIFIKKNLDN
jgi:hypothetical protein